ncbi:uracil-DNA glycosylase [Bradyrhizobium elkanii]
MTISTSNLVAAATRPDSNCPLCPRLAEFRAQARAREPGWFNSPVESFGDQNARLLIVGLAPGLQGANRTGRPFTGDYAGDLLYATLLEYGFASGVYQARPDDGLKLVDARISNAVRCVPPQEQAAAGRDQHLQAIPPCHHRNDAEAARDRAARTNRPRIDAQGAGRSLGGRALCARCRA